MWICLGLASQAGATDELSHTFAGCAGRMSAEMEHAWLMGDDPVQAEAERLSFLSLLEATMQPADGHAVLAHRIESKLAQASLLTIGTFHDDNTRARHARLRSVWHVTQCRDILLGG
ncbi:MAG: hypothetical protein AAF601_06215 [Pseudomonadota bacterium]